METNIRSFKPIEKLGEGSFASVYKVERIYDHQIYALKKVLLFLGRSESDTSLLKPEKTLLMRSDCLPLCSLLISPNITRLSLMNRLSVSVL